MGHDTCDNLFSFRCDFLFNIFLEPPQHERLEDKMKSLELMLVQLTLVHRVLLNILRKPFLELLMVIKKFRHDEMEQSPKLGHRVLNWSSRKKQSVSGLEI